MFDSDLPWWEFVVRASAVYAALLVMVRLSGKRTVGQFTPFDLLVVLLLGEAAGSSLTGQDQSLIGGLLSAGTLIALNAVVANLTARSRRLEGLFDGTPVVLGRNGEIYQSVLRREHVGTADFEKALREADCELAEVKLALLEPDGSITVLKRELQGGQAAAAQGERQ
ncbi:MAG: DUF421 domain-containing protein [Burkholderiales bacterium]|nr:DUF421 domain-containing protein [Burkholderiales bacterium]ODU70440.1 MAG: hypothetical protein ABT05_01580 [Lautropia sp. SCN 66-9]